jgi:hypothetical protein
MSPNSLRVLAGTAAAVLVLLTGIAVGLVGRPQECTPTAGTQPTSAPTTAPTATSPTGGGAVVDNNPGDGTLGETVGGTRPEKSNPPVAAPAPNAATTPASTPANAGTQVCSPGPFAAGTALVALAGAGLTAAVAFGLLLAAGLRRPARATAPVAAPVSGPPGPGRPVSAPPAAGGPSRSGSDPRLDADRAALVRACIYVRDRVTSRALADRLAAALRDAGVTVVEPVGDRFDPARHEAGGATPSSDPSLTGTIAAVEVPGYVDRTGRVLRPPVVTVYQVAGRSAGSNTGQHPTITQNPRRRTEEDR